MSKFRTTAVKIGALACTAAFLLQGVACGKPKTDDSENTLQIFVTNAGYGTQWLTDTIEAFKTQDWVKEKYPNLSIPTPTMNTTTDYIPSQITMGPANTIDLFFSCQSIGTSYGKKDANGNSYFEDLRQSVYGSEVPGEKVLVKDKMNAQIYAEEEITLVDGSKTYYAMPWLNGMMGIMYNETKVAQYLGEGYVMPRTTNELVACTNELKDKLPEGDAPWLFSSGSRYFNAPFIVWWAQYEGKEQYLNYWNGQDEDGNYNKSIFAQTGRLRSLEVYEDLIERSLGNNHEMSTTDGYYRIQSHYVAGQAGVFMPVGDWLMTEMEGVSVTQKIRMMKMPVISSIVEKLEYRNGAEYMSDEMLAQVVQAIDNGETTYDGVSANDMTRLIEARNMMYRMTGHEAFIPAYATGKSIAIDFLRFMATDIGIETFMKATKGTLTPYNYDASAIKESFYDLQKDHYEYMKTVVTLPPESVFKLNYLGGLNQITKVPSVETAFSAQRAEDRMSALDVYNADIDYYNDSVFQTLLQKAGIN